MAPFVSTEYGADELPEPVAAAAEEEGMKKSESAVLFKLSCE